MSPSKRTQSRLDKLAAKVPAETTGEQTTPAKSPGTLLGRQNTISRLASGKQKLVQQLRHSPARVKIWEEHDRDYAALDSSTCADLVDGFRRTGEQEFPAIVRPIPDHKGGAGEHDYELICGARRHWTAAHLGWDLLIEVRELTDLQAFVLLDLENRDREDVSEYERAVNYQRVLPKLFGNKRTDMAKHLDIDKALFGRLLDLADLPMWLVSSYPDRRDLKVHHGQLYKRLMVDADGKRRMREVAKRLTGDKADGRAVFKALKAAGTPPKKTQIRRTRSSYGHIGVDESTSGAIKLSLPAPGKLSMKHVEALRKSFDALLQDYSKGLTK